VTTGTEMIRRASEAGRAPPPPGAPQNRPGRAPAGGRARWERSGPDQYQRISFGGGTSPTLTRRPSSSHPPAGHEAAGPVCSQARGDLPARCGGSRWPTSGPLGRRRSWRKACRPKLEAPSRRVAVTSTRLGIGYRFAPESVDGVADRGGTRPGRRNPRSGDEAGRARHRARLLAGAPFAAGQVRGARKLKLGSRGAPTAGKRLIILVIADAVAVTCRAGRKHPIPFPLFLWWAARRFPRWLARSPIPPGRLGPSSSFAGSTASTRVTIVYGLGDPAISRVLYGVAERYRGDDARGKNTVSSDRLKGTAKRAWLCRRAMEAVGLC